MEKIDLPFFYRLGTEFDRLTKLTAEASTRREIFVASITVEARVKTLLGSFPTLAACRVVGAEFFKVNDAILKWVRDNLKDLDKESPLVDIDFQKVIDKAKEVETVLTAELQTLSTYHVTQKGIYSTVGLIEEAENIFPPAALKKLRPEVVEEIRQSGRCLAFDIPTASAFHILRTIELVMHGYYVAVCEPKGETKKKLENWGAYIAELQKSQAPEAKEVVAMLQQIKDRHRNLIMHPEIVLSPDEAFTLFEVAQGPIIAMAEKLPSVE